MVAPPGFSHTSFTGSPNRMYPPTYPPFRKERAGAHPQRLGPGRGPHPGGRAGELPAGRRQRGGARSAAPLHGRGCRAGPLKNPARIAGFDTQERWQSGRMYLTRNQA